MNWLIKICANRELATKRQQDLAQNFEDLQKIKNLWQSGRDLDRDVVEYAEEVANDPSLKWLDNASSQEQNEHFREWRRRRQQIFI